MHGATLILGSEPRIAVPIARSLHRRGIAVDVAALAPTDVLPRSRAVRAVTALPGGDTARRSEALTALVARSGADTILPVGDSALALLAAHRETLARVAYVACPSKDVVARLLDKDSLRALATECGMAVPTTHAVSDLVDLERRRGELRFPAVAKPRGRTRSTTFKIRHFRAFDELHAAIRAGLAEGPGIVVQPYFPGAGVNVQALTHRGQVLVMMQHRKVKEIPSTGGVGTLWVSESLDPHLEVAMERLLGTLGWEGIMSVEWRRSHETGAVVLLDVNGRYWGSLASAINAGIDFPYYHWQLAHGQVPAVPPSYRAGVRTRWLAGDIRRLDELWWGSPAEAHLRPCSRWREVGRFLADFRPGTHETLWSTTDPWPALAELAGAVRAVAIANLRRLWRRWRRIGTT